MIQSQVSYPTRASCTKKGEDNEQDGCKKDGMYDIGELMNSEVQTDTCVRGMHGIVTK